jgi:hypothetical protein
MGLGLPVLLAETRFGLKLYGRLDEAGFHEELLLLLMASGLASVLARVIEVGERDVASRER